MTFYHIAGLIFAGGLWLIADGAMSILLYLNSNSYRPEEKQGWIKDHSIRLVRLAWGFALAVIGWLMLGDMI